MGDPFISASLVGSFDRLPNRERRCDLLSDGEVMVVSHSAPKNGLGFLNVRETAGAENLFIRLDTHDLADEDGVQPELLVLE